MDKFTTWLKEQDWIQAGDCVYVVSDLLELAKFSREMGMRLQPDEVVECLQRIVGEDGTLLFPTFNWDFCKGIPFDYHKTPVKTGALSKAAWKRNDFTRTAHPIYSFAVWGAKRTEILANTSINSFGPGTIFENMYEWDCKALVIGLPALKGLTYIHHVEQMVQVPYRYNKQFTADYVDAEGHLSQRTYGMYVRDLEMDPRHLDGFLPLENKMQEAGLIKKAFYGEVPCEMLRIRDVDMAVKEDILNNDSRNMYHYHKCRKDEK